MIRQLKIVLMLFVPLCVEAQKVQVVDFSSTACSEPVANADRLITRVIERRLNDGVLELKIGMKEACCLTFKPVVKYYSSSGQSLDTLYVGYKSIGDPCECDCYYELTYKIKQFSKTKFELRFKGKPIEYSAEKYKTFPVKYKIIGTDTVNFVDKYGLRQGIWTSDSVKIKKYYFFKDDVHIRDVTLFDNGNIQKAMKREFGNWNYMVEYFESGQKKRECFNDEMGGSFKDGECKEWNAEGELIYEGPFKKEGQNQ